MKWLRNLMIATVSIGLVGCSNVSLNEALVSGAATTCAGIGASVAGPAGAVTGAAACSVGTATLTVNEKNNLNDVTNEHQADVLKDEHRWMAFKEFGIWMVGLSFLFLLLRSPIDSILNLFRRRKV